jgi:hypothetical protein
MGWGLEWICYIAFEIIRVCEMPRILLFIFCSQLEELIKQVIRAARVYVFSLNHYKFLGTLRLPSPTSTAPRLLVLILILYILFAQIFL